ncbi:hypothetical protein OIE66_26130 [Nonomuraea sp. NBC_01738]|uniref:hypothetical protein n=1 Tax=Nonomuraea sp. NBC_01738 TaxID=2976003 RepID=UPI002E1152E3|nr:hypothetical protein OIE66_26130 [Nonomuraea sp. NBC_01738]
MSATLESRAVIVGDVRVGDGPAVVLGDAATPLLEPPADDAGDAAGAAGLLVWSARAAEGAGAAAATGLPLVVRRSPSATLEEWLEAADRYAAAAGGRVILCETAFDLVLVRAARARGPYPVAVDVSADPGLSRAAVAAGAGGLVLSPRRRYGRRTRP